MEAGITSKSNGKEDNMPTPSTRPKLPVSIDSFERLRSQGFYYVDKTLLIRDLLLDSSDAPLFTRPRRFGKTTVLSMLRTFFEKTDRDTAALFKGTKIENAGAEFMDHQGRYPVVFLSFKDALGDSAQSILDGIRVVIEAECERHIKAMTMAGGLPSHDVKRMRHFVSANASENELAASVNTLCVYLHDFHETAPVVLIDEYDAPVRWVWTLRHRESDAYDKVAGFMRRLLSATLKGNSNRSYACLTGIESVAKTGGESGVNNLTVYGVLDNAFAEYFGFTHEEVKSLLDTFGMSNRYDDICKWYQGYHFGNMDMFNPVSVLSCLRQDGRMGPYWGSTSLNNTIGDALDYATPEVIADMSKLLVPGGTVRAAVSDTLAHPNLPHSPEPCSRSF